MAKTPTSSIVSERRARVGLRDVARSAGVSLAAASYALNQTGNVSAEVRRKVRRVAEELGYTPNNAAQAMRTGKTNSIGLILPDLRNPFFPKLAQAVATQARASDFSVFLVDCLGDPQVELEAATRLVKQGVDGFVWCPCSANDTLAAFRKTVPVVVIDRPMPDYDVVMSDYDAGGRELARLLSDRGAARVGLVTGPIGLPIAQLRRQAFFAHKPASCAVQWEVQTEFGLTLSAAAQDRCRRAHDVDVIVCANDMIAVAVIAELKAAGFDVPRDLGVVGFDDIPWAEIVSPSLTTVRQSLAEIGAQAASLLLSRIASGPGPARHLNIGVEIVRRGSF